MPYGSTILSRLPTQRAQGTGDLRFSYRPGVAFALQALRVHFRRISGSGTDTATMTIDLDCQSGGFNDSDHDLRIKTVTGAGVGADVFLRVEDEELERMRADADYALQVNWTNPDAGEIEWGLTVDCVQVA